MEDWSALRARLAEPHIAPLQAITEEIRAKHPGAGVLTFDPKGPGTKAQLMMVYQRPNGTASITGFICVENPDPTARKATEFFRQAGLTRQNCLLWNVVPFFLGNHDPTWEERAEGMEWLRKIIRQLPNLKSVVLVGNNAHKARHVFRDYQVFRSSHTSQRARTSNPEWFDATPEIWRQAKDAAGL